MIRFCKSIWLCFRRLCGDDAYERYLAHWQTHHAEITPMTRKEFFKAEIERKWSGVKRCC